MAIAPMTNGTNPTVASGGGSGGLSLPGINIQTNGSSGSSNQTTRSTDVLPSWYLNGGQQSTNQYLDMLNGLPEGGYQGDRVADLDPSQQQGIGTAGGYIDPAQGLYNQGAGMMGQGADMIQGSAYWNEPSMMQHMNPYLNGALTTMSNLANQNLMENVMPEVNSTFAGSGQFGSTRNGTFLNNAIRDNQQVISNTQGTMLNDAYKNASDDYFRWGQQAQNAGTAMGALGQQTGQYGIQGLNTGMNLGALNQAQQQKVLDAQKAAWQENYTFPTEVFGGLGNAYNASVGRLTNQGNTTSNMTQSNSSRGSSYSF